MYEGTRVEVVRWGGGEVVPPGEVPERDPLLVHKVAKVHSGLRQNPKLLFRKHFLPARLVTSKYLVCPSSALTILTPYVLRRDQTQPRSLVMKAGTKATQTAQ